MRLLSLEIDGFRGFPRLQGFDLDADAVVVVGANGNGKTSLFDAVLWALSGRIPRLHNDDARLVSMYAETGRARVVLRLKDPATDAGVTVTRSFDGKQGRVALETPERTYQGPSADGRIIELVWPDAAAASDTRDALASVLTQSVYLQQDVIRHFVEAATDQQRFAAVSELVGAGRVTELQASLERDKKAWSTTTNQRHDELRPLRERLAVVEARLADLTTRTSQTGPELAPDAWNDWWKGLAALGLKAAGIQVASREAPAAIDSAIRQLDVLRRSTGRRLEALQVLQARIAELAKRTIPEVRAFRDRVAASQKELDDLKRVVTEEQTRLTEVRRLQAALKEKTEQLKALATLALKHLDDRCPVCGQAYNRDATRIRLEAIVKGKSGDARPSPEPEKLAGLLSVLAAKENEVAAADLAMRSAEQAANESQLAERSLDTQLTALGLSATDEVGRDTAVAKAVADAETLVRRVAELQRVGESLALRLAQSSALVTIEELRRDAETLHREIADREQVIASRNRTGERAQRVIEALREAASAVVDERLREIGPLLQSVYARIDPHPAFRAAAFLSRVVRGKGQLSTVVSDPVEGKTADKPADVLSSSQVNALAVSAFLALNIGVTRPPLSVAMLDDPLQSLDDVNLLGLVDLLRRVKDRRQLCVSTHDGRFGGLLARKLRPGGGNGGTLVIELDGWTRHGPVVRTRQVRSDPTPLRLVASHAG